MSVIANERGATLLETMIALVMVTTIVVAMSLTLPKAMANISNNRRRWFAGNYAASRMQDLKALAYPLIPLTTTGFHDFASTCDCSQDDFTTMPVEATMTQDGITYSRRSCVNFVNRVGGVWQSNCPEATPPITDARDHGLKHIRVRVSWKVGNAPYQIETQGLVAR